MVTTSCQVLLSRLKRHKNVLGLLFFLVTYTALSSSTFYEGFGSSSDPFLTGYDSNGQVTYRSLRSNEEKVDVKAKTNTNTNTKIFGEIDHSKRAIALISFGQSAASSTLVERAIMSIRRRGAFDGIVVLITDAPLDRYEGEFDERVVVLQARESDMKYDHFQNEAIKFKRFKTLIPRYFDLDPRLDKIRHIYYMDIDMMMGAPFYTLVSALNNKYSTENTSSTGPDKIFMFKDAATDTYAVNSGFIVIPRKKSKKCLNYWRDEMDRNPHFIKDQLSLNELVDKSSRRKNYGCQIVQMEIQGEYLKNIENENVMTRLTRYGGYPNLIHIYNSCKAEKFGERKTQQFVNEVLRLSWEERKAKKFGKAVITPLTNGWVPTFAEDVIKNERKQ